MAKVLQHLGHDIAYVENQTCCGQPAFNSGYRKQIIPIAENFIRLFRDKEVIVAPSGSCTAMVRVFYNDLELSPPYRTDWEALKSRIYEFSEFMVDVLKQEDLGGRFPHRVTYHDSCHLNRELGIHEQPRKLIRAIRDIDFAEMEQPDMCCGFGGTFSYKYSDMSIAMVRRKCQYIAASGAEYCVGADSSCLMNIEGYMRQNNFTAKTLHLADLLAASMGL
jgi:L-lactate dehydrogenase complex protein LldE